MNTYEFITIVIAIGSIAVSAFLTWLSIRSSNKSTRQMSILMRENSRMTSSEHLSLYRIEAFYNEVAIKNLEFDIEQVNQQIKTCSAEEKATLETKLKKLQMNHQFMTVRREQLLHNDFGLQKDLLELRKEFNVK